MGFRSSCEKKRGVLKGEESKRKEGRADQEEVGVSNRSISPEEEEEEPNCAERRKEGEKGAK